jgi:hypothetical protein
MSRIKRHVFWAEEYWFKYPHSFVMTVHQQRWHGFTIPPDICSYLHFDDAQNQPSWPCLFHLHVFKFLVSWLAAETENFTSLPGQKWYLQVNLKCSFFPPVWKVPPSGGCYFCKSDANLSSQSPSTPTSRVSSCEKSVLRQTGVFLSRQMVRTFDLQSQELHRAIQPTRTGLQMFL